MRISDWSSDVCSSDLRSRGRDVRRHRRETRLEGLIRLAFARAARHDLDAIIDYIALDDPAAAEKVFRAIVATARRPTRFPEIGPAGPLPGTPAVSVTGMPYLIVYPGSPDTGAVLAVVHGARGLPPPPAEARRPL